MGKIYDALEKYRKERKSVFSQKIQKSDYEVLMQSDEATGRLDIYNRAIIKDGNSLRRLMTYRLIDANGTLTPAGKAKYEELTRKTKTPGPADLNFLDQPKDETQKAALAKKPGKLTASDWALLMQYDRKTGNLLKHDLETGQLDDASRAILQDPVIVQRLIDNNMILPGGWLTPEAKRECSRMEQKNKMQLQQESQKQQKIQIIDKPHEVSDLSKKLNQSDMQALLQFDRKTRKLDMSNPEIIKDPGIVKRLMEAGLIGPDGKLTPKALVRCRVLTKWSPKPAAKEPSREKKRQSVRRKLQTVADPRLIQKEAKEYEWERKEPDISETDKDKQKILQAEAGLIPVTKTPEPTGAGAADVSVEEKSFTFDAPSKLYEYDKVDQNLIAFLNPQSFEAEQFKILRTNLLFPTSGKSPRLIMVTSAVPGEGKSFVAANLAVSVARHVNWNVLLIDCDLRRPSIHRQFGFGQVPGLSDYLSNGMSLPPLLLKTGIDNLTILPAGKPPSNPSELLSSERMSALLGEVAARYDDRLIILDSPPPKLTAETGALARQVDGILLVVKYASTPCATASELIAKLGKDKILGAIVNNFDVRSSSYFGKYYGK